MSSLAKGRLVGQVEKNTCLLSREVHLAFIVMDVVVVAIKVDRDRTSTTPTPSQRVTP